MALHKLIFDVTNRTSKDDGANVGAYLRIGDSGQLASYSNATKAGSITFDFVDGDVTVGTDNIAETAHGLETGDIIQLSTTGTLPTGLSPATDYYVIRVDADNFKLASSLSNAEDGSAVDITAAAGGGTHTVTEQPRTHNALDVAIMDIQVQDIDIRDLSASQDNIAISDGTDTLAVNADGSLNITDNGGSITVDASQLDIDDLNATDDAVAAWLNDGSGNAISSTGGALDVNIASGGSDAEYAEDSAHTSGAVGAFVMSFRVDDLTAVPATALAGTELDYQAFITGPNGELLVGANQLDIDDLNATDDAVAAWLSDGSGNAISSTGGSLDVNVTNSIDVDDGIANTAILQVLESVGTSAAQIVDAGDELANRKYLFIYNNDTQDAFIGASGVTVSDGFPIPPGSILETRIGPAVDVYMIGDKAAMNIRTLQLS